MKLIQQSPKLELLLVVTGMHLLKEFGQSVNEIVADGFPIAARVDMVVGGDSPAAWAKSLGVEIQGMAQVFSILRPDLVIVSGDRGEMLAATMTAAYMNIPVAHIQAGDVTGHIDGSARHAITKLCHIHFASCEDSARRVERMGEEPWRIFNVGAPQLDEVVQGEKHPPADVARRFEADLAQPLLLVIQHPVLVELDQARSQMIETMEAVKALGLHTIVIYPNVDAGGEEIIRVIREYEALPFVRAYKNIERPLFLSLLQIVSVIVGNSSCGILEAPSYELPAVNIGNRERGRMQACNVLNVSHDRLRIAEGVQTALYDASFRERLAGCVNPSGDGHSSERICSILEKIDLAPKLLDKEITY